MHRLLGLRDLVHDAIDEITNLVEETHEAVAERQLARLSLVEPAGRVARGVDAVRHEIAHTVFASVRGTNRGIQALCDQGLALAATALEAARPEWPGEPGAPDHGRAPRAFDAWVDRAESALSGVLGDFLAARGNPLATRMTLRHAGRALQLSPAELAAALPTATGKLCIFIPGLASSDSVWVPRSPAAGASADGAADGGAADGGPPELDFGRELSRELGYTPLYLRYNSGLHISENGRELALLLSELARAYPQPIERIALVGHSMGGLVARSAAHYANEQGQPWVAQLSHVLGIGSPHFGAPLARAGHVLSSVIGRFDTAATQVSARVLQARSAGIKDLSFGGVLDESWLGQDPEVSLFSEQHTCPFVEGVAYGYVAARVHPPGSGPWGEWLGDLLVHVPSASGRHRDPARRIPFHMGHVIDGVHHVALTTHPGVYDALQRFLTECRPPESTRPGAS